MKTIILKPNQINEGVTLLKKGEVLGVPTETVYGLAADATNDIAIKKIFIAKGRPLDHPLIVHLDSFDKVDDWAQDIPEKAKQIADYFWPGPLTMIFKKRSHVSNIITAGLDTIALRIPDHALTLEIIKKLGTAIAAPSANLYKRTSPTKPEHILKTLSGKIPAIIDGGVCQVGLESTIVDMTSNIPVVLRPGAITAKMIQNKTGIEIMEDLKSAKKISGNMAIHYQPEKPLFLCTIDEIKKHLIGGENIAVMHYSNLVEISTVLYYKMPTEKNNYAKMLYETLYMIDATSVEKIIVEQPPQLNEWADVNDRLRKASAK